MATRSLFSQSLKDGRNSNSQFLRSYHYKVSPFRNLFHFAKLVTVNVTWTVLFNYQISWFRGQSSCTTWPLTLKLGQKKKGQFLWVSVVLFLQASCEQPAAVCNVRKNTSHLQRGAEMRDGKNPCLLLFLVPSTFQFLSYPSHTPITL